ncbi:MAG: FHA domain-containing protein [Myxococcota bacterium]
MSVLPPIVVRVLRAPEGSALAEGTALPVRQAVSILGRSPDADVVLPDRTVSRHHARIEVGETVRVTALTSSNGTFLGQLPLREGEPVSVPAHGAELQLGGVVLDLVVLADTAPVFEPVAAKARLSEPALLTVVWDGGQCVARTGRRDLGLTAAPARFLGLLAEQAGDVVHYWDLEQELQTPHLAPLASAVRQAFLGALQSGSLDAARVHEQVRDLCGIEASRLADSELMRSLVQARRGHGYVLNLSDVVVVRI